MYQLSPSILFYIVPSFLSFSTPIQALTCQELGEPARYKSFATTCRGTPADLARYANNTAASFSDCADQCESDTNCKVFIYNPKSTTCTLASAEPAKAVVAQGYHYDVAVKEYNLDWSALNDHQSKKCSEVSANGYKGFKASCDGYNIKGGRLLPKPALGLRSFTQCIDECTVTTRCVAVSWRDQQICYLYDDGVSDSLLSPSGETGKRLDVAPGAQDPPPGETCTCCVTEYY